MVDVLAPSSSSTIRVLHLDDDEALTELTPTFLGQEDIEFEVITENSPESALELVETRPIDCIVSDYEMPTMDGLEFLDEVRSRNADLPFILFTGKGSEEIASEAISRGVTDYLQKGSGTDQYTVLANRIKNAVGQYRAEQEVEERSEWYSRILEHSSDYVLIVNEMGNVRYVSPAIERVMGYSQEQIIGNDAFEFVHPDDLDHAAEALGEIIEDTDREVTIEFRSEASDGSTRWLEVRGRNFLDDSLIQGVLVNVRDITQRKTREQELQRQQSYLQHSTDIIAVLTADGIVEYISPSIERVLGYTPSTLTGVPLDEYVHPDHEQIAESLFESLRSESDVEKRGEFKVQRADGSWAWLDVRGTNQLADPIIEGIIVNARDITERKDREHEIERQNERLDEFAQVVSHDLRNPLNVASGHLELLSNNCDSDHIENIRNAHERMMELIESLLTLAESGEQVHDPVEVAIDSLAKASWDGVQTASATLSIETTLTILADRSRARQLMENLFRNAIEHGGDAVTVTVGNLADGRGFYVADDGSGIPADERERAFTSGYSTSDHGRGFGLSIVRQVANAHGWDVDVLASDTGGARFEIRGVEVVEREPAD